MKVQPKPNHNDINGWFVIGGIGGSGAGERSWGAELGYSRMGIGAESRKWYQPNTFYFHYC